MVKNLPATAGDMGLTLDLGGFHTLEQLRLMHHTCWTCALETMVPSERPLH